MAQTLIPKIQLDTTLVDTTSTQTLTNKSIAVTQLTGTLGVANGGTGAVTITGLVKGNGTGAFTAATAGTDYQVPITLTTTGTTGAATFASGTLNIPNYSSGSGGITRSINSISTATTGGATAATDYVYLVSGTTTFTLPTAVSNTNLYTVKNTGTATVTIATTSSQTVTVANNTALTTITVAPGDSYQIISNNTNWQVI
jgi:hypothetical protein